jgi:hypothetical protein
MRSTARGPSMRSMSTRAGRLPWVELAAEGAYLHQRVARRRGALADLARLSHLPPTPPSSALPRHPIPGGLRARWHRLWTCAG